MCPESVGWGCIRLGYLDLNGRCSETTAPAWNSGGTSAEVGASCHGAASAGSICSWCHDIGKHGFCRMLRDECGHLAALWQCGLCRAVGLDKPQRLRRHERAARQRRGGRRGALEERDACHRHAHGAAAQCAAERVARVEVGSRWSRKHWKHSNFDTFGPNQGPTITCESRESTWWAFSSTCVWKVNTWPGAFPMGLVA